MASVARDRVRVSLRVDEVALVRALLGVEKENVDSPAVFALAEKFDKAADCILKRIEADRLEQELSGGD